MTFEEYKKARLRMETKMTENWAHAYSVSIFKQNHPKKAAEYETRFEKEQNCHGGVQKVRMETDKEKIKEIMSIESCEERHKAILENMELFNRYTSKGRKEQEYTGCSVAEMQKRSEIMNIKDIDMRRRAIAENFHLFENQKKGGKSMTMTYGEYKKLKNRANYFDETEVFRFEKENPELATSYMNRMLRDAEKKREIFAIEDPDERYIAIAKNKDLF